MCVRAGQESGHLYDGCSEGWCLCNLQAVTSSLGHMLPSESWVLVCLVRRAIRWREKSG